MRSSTPLICLYSLSERSSRQGRNTINAEASEGWCAPWLRRDGVSILYYDAKIACLPPSSKYTYDSFDIVLRTFASDALAHRFGAVALGGCERRARDSTETQHREKQTNKQNPQSIKNLTENIASGDEKCFMHSNLESGRKRIIISNKRQKD